MENKKGYFCDICGEIITKYQLDLHCCGIIVQGKFKLICDDCAKKVALYVVEEF